MIGANKNESISDITICEGPGNRSMSQQGSYIVVGLSRVAVRVARRLVAASYRVVLVRTLTEGLDLLHLLPDEVEVLSAAPSQEISILTQANLSNAYALLALSDDDFANLKAAVASKDLSPNTPVVLRTFDPALADQLEGGLNVRRAYSVSSLAAPAFVAAACGDTVLETLRLADSEVPLAIVTLRPGSVLVGMSVAEVEAKFGCSIILSRLLGDIWTPPESSKSALQMSEQLLVGGPLKNVLRLVCCNASWITVDGKVSRRRRAVNKRRRRPFRRATNLPYVAAALAVMLIIAIAVFHHFLHLSLIDSIYFVVTTATTTGYGDISLVSSPGWLKMFGCAVMLTGGALLGVLFSYFASVATAERLEDWMGRRAERMSGHIVVAGLGHLGYRVTRLLVEQGLDVVAIEMSPRDRFVAAIQQRTPVLTGDTRLPEILERASIRSASAFIGCTSDDLANVFACLQANRMNPNITNVARIFDDDLSERLGTAFAINHVLSASECAAGAFVGAAVDDFAIRPIRSPGLNLAACRYRTAAPLAADRIAAMRADGVCVIAFSLDGATLTQSSYLPSTFPAGTHLILCGPYDVVHEIISSNV